MPDNTTYTTKGGETWTLISYKAYGDPFLYKTITDANPLVPVDDLLDAGIVLSIPVLDGPDSNMDTSQLPPWKQVV